MVGMSLAMGLGSVLGLIVFENLAIGFAIALPLGAAGGLFYDARHRARTEATEAAESGAGATDGATSGAEVTDGTGAGAEASDAK